MNRLAGKVVIVVGGGSGSAPGSALRIALEGATVILADLDSDTAATTAEAIQGEGGNATHETVDVQDEATVSELMARVIERHGRIDGLHNDISSSKLAAGDTHIVDLDTETWEDQIQSSLRGYFYTTKHVIPHMVRGGGGSIVNLSAASARSAQPMSPAYSIAKGGVLSLTAAVVATYGKYGVRCNAILPGFVVNERTAAKFSDEFRAMVMTHIPYTRLGNPDDIGRLSAFLLSGDADYISGQEIAVDGGLDTPGPLYSDLPKPTV
jgi:NAD(P)-dependent dehydrogenase (short-subunit alcohol dehydrogenase family)